MKTRWNHFPASHRTPTLVCGACLALLMSSHGQVNPVLHEDTGAAKSISKQDFTIRVAVEEVRIDAVVVDRKGHQIKDLTADDFELYQDGRLQKITSCTYLADYQQPPAGKKAPQDSLKPASLMATRLPPKDKARRTIVVVVDDLSMDFEHVSYARMALQKFVESQMQAGDLLAILQTSSGIGIMRQLTSDKQQLLSTIRNIRWRASRTPTSCFT